VNKKTLFLILLAVVLVSYYLPQVASADQPCDTLNAAKTAFRQIGATIVVIGWIITGILYLTAGGGERLGVAKKALIACVIGTALIILAPIAYTFINSAFNLGGGSSGECQ